MIKLVKQHQKIIERAAQAGSATPTGPSEREPLLKSQRTAETTTTAAEAENERLQRASNLK